MINGGGASKSDMIPKDLIEGGVSKKRKLNWYWFSKIVYITLFWLCWNWCMIKNIYWFINILIRMTLLINKSKILTKLK